MFAPRDRPLAHWRRCAPLALIDDKRATNSVTHLESRLPEMGCTRNPATLPAETGALSLDRGSPDRSCRRRHPAGELTLQDLESFNDQPIARGVGDTASEAIRPCGRALVKLSDRLAEGWRRRCRLERSKRVELVGAQADRGRGEILLEMRYRGGPGNWQYGGGTLQ